MKKAELQSKYQLLIGGQWKDASDGKLFKTTCPADGSFLAECAEATREDVDEAVAAAWKAFESWKNTTVAERAAVLNKIAARITLISEICYRFLNSVICGAFLTHNVTWAYCTK